MADGHSECESSSLGQNTYWESRALFDKERVFVVLEDATDGGSSLPLKKHILFPARWAWLRCSHIHENDYLKVYHKLDHCDRALGTCRFVPPPNFLHSSNLVFKTEL